jgi:hypothetical protein
MSVAVASSGILSCTPRARLEARNAALMGALTALLHTVLLGCVQGDRISAAGWGAEARSLCVCQVARLPTSHVPTLMLHMDTPRPYYGIDPGCGPFLTKCRTRFVSRYRKQLGRTDLARDTTSRPHALTS